MSEPINKMDSLSFAVWLHNQYEEIAKDKKWNTQEKCKVDFWSLPRENQETMIELAIRIKNNLR